MVCVTINAAIVLFMDIIVSLNISNSTTYDWEKSVIVHRFKSKFKPRSQWSFIHFMVFLPSSWKACVIQASSCQETGNLLQQIYKRFIEKVRTRLPSGERQPPRRVGESDARECKVAWGCKRMRERGEFGHLRKANEWPTGTVIARKMVTLFCNFSHFSRLRIIQHPLDCFSACNLNQTLCRQAGEMLILSILLCLPITRSSPHYPHPHPHPNQGLPLQPRSPRQNCLVRRVSLYWAI